MQKDLEWLNTFQGFGVIGLQAEKKGDKKGPFFLSGSSYNRDKQNEREYFVQIRH